MMNDDHLCISRCRLIELNTLNSSPTPVLQDTDMPTVQHQWFHAFGISFQMEQRSTRTRRTKLLSLIRVLMAQATTRRPKPRGLRCLWKPSSARPVLARRKARSSVDIYNLFFITIVVMYIKRLLRRASYILKRLICVWLFNYFTHALLEKFNNKRSELKYLSNFRKINQTRFYD